MADVRFIVWMGAISGQFGPKVFDDRWKASAYASQRVADDAEKADIYEVTLTGISAEKMARAAIAALEQGQGRFVEARSSRISEAEFKRIRKRDWERAMKEGPEAMLKFLGL